MPAPQATDAVVPLDPEPNAPTSRKAAGPPPAPLPARALTAITVEDNGARRVIDKGEVIPETILRRDQGLKEGKHFKRGSLDDSKPKAVQFKGKLAKTVKTNSIEGYDPADEEKPPLERRRKTFARGEVIPTNQLAGLKEGVHYE